MPDYQIQTAFSAGEISPELYGQVSFAKYHSAASTMRNMYVNYRGGANSRAGTALCLRSKQPYGTPPRLINFQFSISQGYCLEFGEHYMRVFSNGAPVVLGAVVISGATQATECQITTATPHFNLPGDWVIIENVIGMTELNGNVYIVDTVTTNTFTIKDLNGVPVNTTGFPPYISGGLVSKVFELATPYAAIDLPLLKFTQSADVMSLTHPNYPPYDLTRISPINWTLNAVTFGANIAPPGGCVGIATTPPNPSFTPPTLPASYAYVVTAVDKDTGEESVASPVANITNGVDISETAGSNIIVWSSSQNAGSYNIYKAPTSYNTEPGNTGQAAPVPIGAPFGYIATAFGNQFVDSNIAPDFSQVPPTHYNPFASGGVAFVNITNPGVGYTFANVTITTSTGNSFHGVPIIVGGSVFAVFITNAGEFYLPSDTITISQPPIVTGAFTAVAITNAGSGYVAPSVVIQDPTGQGVDAEITVTQSGGSLATVTVVNPGRNYSVGTTLVVADSKGTGGQLTPTIGPMVITPGVGATATLQLTPNTGTYPGCVAYFQQRRVYASTINNPDTYYMSQPGIYTNFDTSIPVVATDSITGTPWAQQVNGIQFMVPMPAGLIVFTGLGAWQVGGSGSSGTSPQPITPSSQQATPQAFNGCSNIVPPIAIDYDILYVQSKGSIVLDLSYNYYINIYTGNDLTFLSSQLFNGHTIVQWAWCREPYKIVWAVREDGVLLSLTYVKQQEIYGWARHDTMGQIVSVTSVTEPPVDALYLAVARPLTNNGPAGGQAYYVERMDDRFWNTIEDVWCVDCGLEYPMPEPNTTLGVYITGPNLGNIVATSSVFSNANIGNVVRAVGGIGTITSVSDGQHASVAWSVLPNQKVPNDPNGNFELSPPGYWTMTAPISRVTGLIHLAGMTVTGVADGAVITPRIVAPDGSINLDKPATNIKVGLGFTAQLQTPYFNGDNPPTDAGRRKTVMAVTARVDDSAMMQYGSNQLDGAAQSPPLIAPVWSGMVNATPAVSTYTSSGGYIVTPLSTSNIRTIITSDWNNPGQVAFQQTQPFPMNINAVIPEFLEGDVPETGYAQRQDRQGRDRPSPRMPGTWMIQG